MNRGEGLEKRRREKQCHMINRKGRVEIYVESVPEKFGVICKLHTRVL